jgi:hypothetical protein
METKLILSSDRIATMAYIKDFHNGWYSSLLSKRSMKGWKDYIQGNIRDLAEKEGIAIHHASLKKGFRAQLDRDYSLREDKVLAIFRGFETWFILDSKTGEKTSRRVLTYYILVWDQRYGLVGFRICTWVPCLVYVYFNAHDFLFSYCEENGIEYKAFRNSFEHVELTRKEIKRITLKHMRLSKLNNVARKWFDVFFKDLTEYYSFTYSAIEFDLDQEAGKNVVRQGIRRWILRNVPAFEGSQILSILEQERIIIRKEGKDFVPQIINERTMLLNWGLQFKAYVKGSRVRFELTYNSAFMKTKRNKFDRTDLRSIYAHAVKSMQRIFEITKRVKVRSRLDFSLEMQDQRPLILKEPDIKFLNAVRSMGINEFKNMDIRTLTGLNYNQVYYRLKVKFKDYFSLDGKVWSFTGYGFKLVLCSLRFAGRFVGLWHSMLYGWKGVTIGVDSSELDELV